MVGPGRHNLIAPLFAKLVKSLQWKRKIQCGNSCGRMLCKPVQQRWIFVEKQKLCFNCLGSKHTRNICRCSQKCKSCNKPHHTLLHNDEMTASANRAKRNHCDGANSCFREIRCFKTQRRCEIDGSTSSCFQRRRIAFC